MAVQSSRASVLSVRWKAAVSNALMRCSVVFAQLASSTDNTFVTCSPALRATSVAAYGVAHLAKSRAVPTVPPASVWTQPTTAVWLKRCKNQLCETDKRLLN